MARYIYGCTEDKEHPRKEVRHGMTEDPEIRCAECNALMARIPQTFMFGQNPQDRLMDEWTTRANKHFYEKYGRKDYVGTDKPGTEKPIVSTRAKRSVR